jgi:hypothetical protein
MSIIISTNYFAILCHYGQTDKLHERERERGIERERDRERERQLLAFVWL